MKSASGAGAQEWVQWEMGLQVGMTGGGSGDGCQGSITTLGEGALLKSSRWGVAWKQGKTGAGDGSVEAASLGGGLQERTSNRGRQGVGGNGEVTLGGSWGSTLGRPGIGVHMNWQAGGARRCQDSKMSRRLAIASPWEVLVQGAAPARAPVIT
jgi:hypothetical protein